MASAFAFLTFSLTGLLALSLASAAGAQEMIDDQLPDDMPAVGEQAAGADSVLTQAEGEEAQAPTPAAAQGADDSSAKASAAEGEPSATAALPAATPPSAGSDSNGGEAKTRDELGALHLRHHQANGRMFGSYRVRVGAARPNFDDGLKGYKELYGSPGAFPTIAVDWFPFDWYATLGLSLRFGYYSADGSTSKSNGKKVEAFQPSDIVKDPNGPTTLTLLPLQIAAAAEFTPFDRKWIVLDGWIGYERLYWQEVRTKISEASPTAKPSSGSNSNAAEASDDSLVNKGTKSETAIGFAANILLNPLDEQSVRSTRGTLGIESVYLSPYVQIVRTLSKTGASFGRSELGLAFTFETVR